MIRQIQVKRGDDFVDAYCGGMKITEMDVSLLPRLTEYRINKGNGEFSEVILKVI